MADSSEGHSSLGPSTSSSVDLSTLLRQKEHDIEIAAQIGQSLLERNRELQLRNEFLEESLVESNEQTIQLRHELQRRVQLLKFFSVDADEHDEHDGGPTSTLCRQMDRLRRENLRLTAETNVLRRDLEGKEGEQRRIIADIEEQLATVTAQAHKLQTAIVRKNEECAVHGENINRLIEEVARRSTREKDLSEENESLVEQLETAMARERELSDQMTSMQDLYAELKTMFHDAEEELRTYRKKPSPYRTPSVDSLYDSLASELETSDSGRWTPRTRREPPSKRLDLPSSPQNSPPLAIKEDTTPTQHEALLPCQLEALEAPSTAAEPETSRTADEEGLLALESVHSAQLEPEETDQEEQQPQDKEPAESQVEHEEPITSDLTSLPEVEKFLSLPEPVEPPAKIPDYIEGVEDFGVTPRSRSSSSHSLSDYEAPSLGEPGVPGTRDLKASIKKAERVRRQVREACPLEHDFAAFRARKGFRPSSFFSPSSPSQKDSILSPYLVGDSRSVLPWRLCSAVGLQAVKALGGGGVLTRAELTPVHVPSPTVSPTHSVQGLRLATLTSSSFSPSGGIVLRRPFL